MKLTPKKKEHVIRLLREGIMTFKEIQAESGVSQPTIRKIRREIEPETETVKGERIGRFNRVEYYDDDIDEWQDVHIMVGVLFTEIFGNAKRIETLEKQLTTQNTLNTLLIETLVNYGLLVRNPKTT